MWQQKPVYLILPFRQFPAGEQEEEQSKVNLLNDVSRLNKPFIQIKNLTVFSTLPPEDTSKMQKRTGGALHGSFVEIIWAVIDDRGYFSPSFPCMVLCGGYKLEPL